MSEGAIFLEIGSLMSYSVNKNGLWPFYYQPNTLLDQGFNHRWRCNSKASYESDDNVHISLRYRYHMGWNAEMRMDITPMKRVWAPS